MPTLQETSRVLPNRVVEWIHDWLDLQPCTKVMLLGKWEMGNGRCNGTGELGVGGTDKSRISKR